MFERTGDPLDDFARHDAEQADALDKLPKCSECEHPIQDEKLYEFDGALICKRCLIDNHEKETEDFVI